MKKIIQTAYWSNDDVWLERNGTYCWECLCDYAPINVWLRSSQLVAAWREVQPGSFGQRAKEVRLVLRNVIEEGKITGEPQVERIGQFYRFLAN